MSGGLERLLPIAPVAASFLVYVAVIGNGFFYDDFIHLYRLANGPLYRVIFEPHAGHWLFSFNVIIAACHAIFGANSALYYLVIVVVHCANVWLVQSILARTTGWPYLAAFGAALFGMCPTHVGSVGWLSVLGHVTATTAVLLVLRDLVRIQQKEIELDRRTLVRAALLLLVAASSFGTGLGVAVGFGAILYIWNPDPERRIGPALAMVSLAVVISLIYFGTGQLNTGQGEGALIESEASYIEHLPELPGNMLRLLLVGMGSLLGGPLVVGKIVPISDEWLLTVVFALGAVGFAAIALASGMAGSTARRRFAALCVLVCCGYIMIALARWFLLEDPRPIVRYHYLGPAIFSLLFCLACRELFAGAKWPARHAQGLFYGWLAVVIVPYALAIGLNDEMLHLEQKAQYHTAVLQLERDLNRMSERGDVIYLRNEPIFETAIFLPSYAQFPGRAALFVILHDENSFNGVPVRFVERDADNLRKAVEVAGSRMSELLVANRSGRLPKDRLRKSRP